MAIPDWLSIQEISRLWGEETGHDPSAFQKDLREWFAEFVKEPPTSRQLMPGVTFDTIIANRLLGMLGARYLERKTFEAYCEDRGHSKPRFWFAGWEAERDPSGASLEQPQQELTERPVAASAQVAELKLQLEAADRRDSVNYRDSHTNSQPLRQTTARQKRRSREILVAGLVVPLVALLLWGAESLIQLTASQREIARLSAAVEASDAVIAKLHDELVIVRQAVESAQQITSAGTREQLDAALASAIDAEKSAARAQAKTMRLRAENTRLTDEFTRTKAIFDFLDSGATKNPGQKQDAEVVEARPEIEEILAATKISSDFLTSETGALRDTVSSDDLLLKPMRHVGREVVVTGSVVWLLRRYWLQSDSGSMNMLIDVKGLQADDRNKLKDAVVQIEFFAQARARITGTVERQGSEDYRLAATELVLVE
jgi:hypothetical protein